MPIVPVQRVKQTSQFARMSSALLMHTCFVLRKCAEKGNMAKAISGKLAAVQYFQRVNVKTKLLATLQRTDRELAGIKKVYVEVFTP